MQTSTIYTYAKARPLMVSSSETEEILEGASAELRESHLQLPLFPLGTGSKRWAAERSYLQTALGLGYGDRCPFEQTGKAASC